MEGALAPPEAASVGDSGQQAPLDSIVIHPHICEPQSKAPASMQLTKQLMKYVGSGDKAEAKRFAEQLESARTTLQGALDSATMSESSVLSSLDEYVGLLLGLIDKANNASPVGSPEAAVDGAPSADGQAQPQGGQGVRGDAPLRRAISFSWHDTLVSSCTAARAYPDAVFELASALVATGVWLMRRAASLCRDSASGVASPACVQANKLLRQAAGMLDFAQTWLLPLMPAGVSDDCSQQVVKGLSLTALGDCQLLTVLRAIQKGNQPSLIASIAEDTAVLYRSALQAVLSSNIATAPSSKLAHYLRYKQASLTAYAYCFAGLAQWKGEQAGSGLRCLQEAQACADAGKKAYLEFDKAAPTTLTNAHRRYDEILQALIVDSRQRVQRENDAVFLQKVPTQLPESPAPRRLVAPTPYTLPAPARGAKEGAACFAAPPAAVALEMQAPAVQGSPSTQAKPAGAPPGTTAQRQEGQQEEQGCCCSALRWLLFLIAFPLMLLISAVGIVVWVVLLPVKIICCPCGCLIQLLANVVEYLIKAPLRLILWVTGKPWEGPSGKEKGEAGLPV